MSIGDAIGGVAGLWAGDRQADAAEDAARAQAQEAERGRQLIGQYHDQFASNAAPYMQTGQQGLSALQRLMGGDYSQALAGPDYRARFDMGLQATDRSAAARGSLHSGGHSADLLNYGGQMASQGIGDYRNALFGMAGLGANMTSNLGSAGLSAASGMAQQGNLAGQARASGYTGSADAWGQTAFGLGGLLNQAGQSRGWWG
jgi:hypothetical protein